MADAALKETSLAVWAVPATVAAGERFAIKVGAKSSADCELKGRRVEIRDAAGVTVASGALGDAPWPDTAALFWTELELTAPPAPGLVALEARFDAAELDDPHAGSSASFNVAVVARPEHTLTVTVAAGDTPIAEAYVRLGPYRAVTDAAGHAEIRLAGGRYELQVWKADYDTPVTPLDIAADASVRVEAQRQPEENPDAIWTA